jgi:predicted GNAT superfamily acetyltransferase
VSLPFATADLDFVELDDDSGWTKRVGDRTVVFRILRSLTELSAVEVLQRDVFGVTDLDLAAASQLVSVQETGGDVLGAFVDQQLLGFLISWGGFVNGRPRLLSDMLAVRADARGLGLGTELKTLQGAIAVARGFVEVVWTVDPMRAANARLNFEKLGAIADRYEVNRYGAGYAMGLYGGLPTDRLHVTWSLTNPRVRDRLLGRVRPLTAEDVTGLHGFDPDSDVDRTLIYLPANVDRLDATEAMEWRLSLRHVLQCAFARGLAITGFVAGVDPAKGGAAYLIERREDG